MSTIRSPRKSRALGAVARRENADLEAAVARACDRIAPAWPLDRLIAVNPFWGFVDAPIEKAAAEIGALSGATLLMPRAWYREQFAAERFNSRHIAQATRGSRASVAMPDIRRLDDTKQAPSWQLMTDVVDLERDLAHAMPWGEYVTRHVSQTCAAFFDDEQARWRPIRDAGLYPLWRELAARDRGPRLLTGLRGFRKAAAKLPESPRSLIADAVAELKVPGELCDRYLTALLLSVNGWASACAFRRWEARLAGSDDDQIVHLLAVRLAWELLLYRLSNGRALDAAWRSAQESWASTASIIEAAQREDWLLQRAAEIGYVENVARRMAPRNPTTPPTIRPSAQVVFCIDVRSEPLRRALERVTSDVQTLGFAGFFGLPVAYRSLLGEIRPQLPGLLTPALLVEDEGPTRSDAVAAAHRATSVKATWKSLGRTPASAFSFVEAAGLAWLPALVRDGFGFGTRSRDPLRDGVSRDTTLRPRLANRETGGAPDLSTKVRLAAGILRAMSLTRDFAPVLALIGHRASTTNNPLAAGLQCGACGGQTGEVNARALAGLLGDPEVRGGLAGEGIDLGTTHVVAGLHDTTTDEVTLYDLDRVPPTHASAVAALAAHLNAAAPEARRARRVACGSAPRDDAALERAANVRARDWAEVRPEWGLAGNAAFIIAPRERTKGVDLEGRAFLHEYRWEQDTDFKVLELILTAPMIVTHWINLQYYASTVDPVRYGSGTKTLHNVTGGHVGIMEGAGGDLRIGLARQSVHDGRRLVHDPLRLSVFVEAPSHAIDAILARHVTVRNLVFNEWLFLYRIDPSTRSFMQRGRDDWHAVHD